MAKAEWSHAIRIIQPTGSNIVTRALSGNPLRRGLLVSGRSTALVALYDAQTAVLDTAFATLFCPGFKSFPFRDFGSLITGEIWIANLTINIPVVVTEIFLIPSGGHR